MTLRIDLPGSKSITQRALIIASLSPNPVTLRGALDCDDSRHLVAMLQRLGVRITWKERTVQVEGAPLVSQAAHIDCGNAGTTMRFGTALALVCEGEFIMDGSDRMRERPIAPLGEALGRLSVEVTYLGQPGYPPLRLRRVAPPPARVAIESSVSSQFASGLLLVGPALKTGLTLELTGARVSTPYLTMTTGMMKRCGASVRWRDPGTIEVAPQPYAGCTEIEVEPDWSAAAFVLAAAKVAACQVDLAHLPPPENSLQGDARFAEFMHALEKGDAQALDLTETPDLIAPLAALCLFANQPTQICGAAHTRVKESDRIAVLCHELRKIGADITEHDDGMTIQPLRRATQQQVELDPAGDHRMAMAFGVASLRVPGIRVRDPACVTKSFPHFWPVLESIRAQARDRSPGTSDGH